MPMLPLSCRLSLVCFVSMLRWRVRDRDVLPMACAGTVTLACVADNTTS